MDFFLSKQIQTNIYLFCSMILYHLSTHWKILLRWKNFQQLVYIDGI